MAPTCATHVFKLIVSFMALSSFSHAYDHDPLQDFCVAVPDASAAVFVNGKICKSPKLVTPDDFHATGLNVPSNTNNSLGVGLNVVSVNRVPGLNTLGLTVVRVDFAPNGVVPPHVHPRATEVLVVLEGTLYVGFVTSNPSDGTKNRLFSKTLNAGDVYAFPPGLVHFQRNVGNTTALGIVSFNSQNPGIATSANSIFGSDPPISSEVLTKSFQLDKKTVDYLQSRHWI
ncbi:OLC1v1001389C1 [Oldenlandia corymbosa var. corymbosa]|uniref:Germin-like protein n=1 Tax=Oldenlandia corymbosa var. corymbosa TaxID=529605 RepID=A0AAV1D5V9_OLDCO|nr:OLC1v1001389C1 [Oldenlandia corymbosa var. corymbosa]